MKNTRTIVAAPQVGNVQKLRENWQRKFLGTDEDFYNFITTPSAARSLFLSSRTPEISTTKHVLLKTY